VIENQAINSELPPCGVSVSQENISLINDGGIVGLLVTVEKPGDVKNLTATSSSPKDIEVTMQAEIGGISDSRYFVIKSTSSSLGVYTITFAAACGKKNVAVTVR
jgi:hypothetical protein